MNLPLPIETIIEAIIYTLAVASFGLLMLPAALRLSLNERATRTLVVYLALGITWGIGGAATALALAPTEMMAMVFRWLASLGQISLPLIFGALTLSFLNQTKILYWYWGIGFFLFGLWILFKANIETLTGFVNTYIPTPPDILARYLSIIIWGASSALAVWSLYQGFKQHYQAEFLNKLRYWVTGILILSAANIILFMNLPISPWLGPILNIVGVLLVAYTVMLYHPPDLTVLFSRLAQSTTVTLALSIFIFGALLLAFFSNRWQTDLDFTLMMVGLSLIAILVAFMTPIFHRWLNNILGRTLFGHRLDEEIIISKYSQQVGGELSLEKLCRRVLEFICQETGAKRGAIYLDEGDGTGHVTLRCLATINMPKDQLGHFSGDDPWITYLRERQLSITQYNLDVLPDYRSMTLEGKTWLTALNAEVFIPIVLRQRELLGVLALGSKPNQTPYLKHELARLNILMSQTALDIDKVKIFTQLGEVNQKLDEISSQLEGGEQGKTDFLSIASHELRTPLTQIHGYAAMLVEATEDELRNPAYLQQIFQGIAKGSTRLKDVVDLIFEVSKAEINELDLRFRSVTVDEIVKQAVATHDTALEQRKQELIIEGVEILPPIKADRERLVQALTQLINNAVKYTPDGGKIMISGLPIEEKGQVTKVELVISDTGIGIDKDNHDRIFEKFYRVGNIDNHSTGSIKFKGAGPGLGLTLVSGVVRAHGGEVWVESKEYNEDTMPGSQFHIILPVNPPEKPVEKIEDNALLETRHWSQKEQDELRRRAAEAGTLS